MSKKPRLYVHQDTGDVVSVANKAQARQLPEPYKRVEFIKNDEGKNVMRLRLRSATVDVSENGEREVVLDGNRTTE
jgi:hypothetical protein